MALKMTKAEFIAAYARDAGIEEYATADGYSFGETFSYVALPCACGEDECHGWAMVSDCPDDIEEHLRMYGPKNYVLTDEDGHEAAMVDRWPEDVLREDHPTPSEGDCVSTASVEGRTTPSYAALAEICD